MYTDECGSFDIGLGYQVGGDRIRTTAALLCVIWTNVNMFLVKVLISIFPSPTPYLHV